MADDDRPNASRTLLESCRDGANGRDEVEVASIAEAISLEDNPWPQPSPWFPDAMLPAVLNVPEFERDDWRRNVLARYVEQLLTEGPRTLASAAANPELADVSDERFVELLGDGPVARFLTARLDSADVALFAPFLGSSRFHGSRWLKADFRAMRLIESRDQGSVAETVVLFARDQASALTLVAIAVNDQVFVPDGSDGFTLAKYFALQSAGICVTLQMHPQLHLPFDALNAIARTRLPDGHVLKELLRPHLRLELAIADAVLHGERSVLVPGYPYSPYPCTQRESLQLMQTIWTGLPHRDETANRAYPRFTYPIRPRRVEAPYGRFLDRYYESVLEFVSGVLSTLDPDDADAAGFARHAAHYLPGFPERRTSEERRDFVQAIATMIFSVSIAHTTDHALYGCVDPREMPFRLRASPPRPGVEVELDRSTLVEVTDLASYALCSKLYFEPHPVARLVEVEYAFSDPALVERGRSFIATLRAVESGFLRDRIGIYLSIDEMAASVQF